MEDREQRALEEFARELGVLKSVVYRSKNVHRSAKFFKKAVHLKRICSVFLSGTLENGAKAVCDTAEDLYVLSTSNIPDGYFIGCTLALLGLSSKIRYLAREVDGTRRSKAGTIDKIFAEIE